MLYQVLCYIWDHPWPLPWLRSPPATSPTLTVFLSLFRHFLVNHWPNTTDHHPRCLLLTEVELLRPPSTPALATIIVGDVAIPDNNFAHFSAVFSADSWLGSISDYLNHHHLIVLYRSRLAVAPPRSAFSGDGHQQPVWCPFACVYIRACVCVRVPATVSAQPTQPTIPINLDWVSSARLGLVQPTWLACFFQLCLDCVCSFFWLFSSIFWLDYFR